MMSAALRDAPIRKSCAAGSAARSSARASASVSASGKIRIPKIPAARPISAAQSASRRAAASAQVTISVHGCGAGGARGLAGGELHEPGGRSACGRRAARRHERPEIRRFPQIVRGNVPEQQRMKNALAGVASQVPGEYRVGDLHAGDGIGQPGSEDHPVALVGQIVRERERLFREPGEPVTDLRRDGREDREPDRTLATTAGASAGSSRSTTRTVAFGTIITPQMAVNISTHLALSFQDPPNAVRNRESRRARRRRRAGRA